MPSLAELPLPGTDASLASVRAGKRTFKERFYAIRGGNAFFGILAGFLAVWFIVRWFVVFDQDNAWLNLLLSIEASTTTSLLLDLQLKTTTHDQAVFARLEHMAERILQLEETLASVHEAVKP